MSRSSDKRSVTIPVRVPDEVYAEVRQWAQLAGKSPGDVLREAWNEWIVVHKEEILADLEALRADIEAR